jgi:hypothetical protein
MSTRSLWLPLILLTPAACQTQSADLVVLDAVVYTANNAQPTAEGVAVTAGKVVFVGSSADAQAYVGDDTEVIHLGGQALFPGFVDSHAHLSGVGSREQTLNLEGSLSIETLLARLKERVDLAAPGEWVTGRGWIETHWVPRRFPTRQDLDLVSPHNPVILGRSDGHAAVANSAALRIAGITRETQPPAGGDILKDASGEPTGMLIDAARGLVGQHVPDVTEAELERAIEVGAEREVRYGWTQVQDAGGSWREVARMRKLYGEGRIQLRIYKTVNGPSESADSLLAHGASVDEFNGLFTHRTIKVVMDGALGSRGALLLKPYSDAPETHGLLTTNLDRLRPMMVEALRKGIQVEAHAIGDSANRLLLDLIEEAQAAVPVSERAIAEPRWRDEHTQIVDPADLPRFKQLGVIPSMQASHAIGDLHFAPSRLGDDRLVGGYAWQTLLGDGNRIAGGSDAPVERGEPLIEFYASVARRDTTGFQGPNWRPEEAMTRDQALKSLTIWPAYAAFEEDRRGSIEVGKWADFTVFSADIMTIPEDQILKARNVMTLINGKVVYREE